MPGVSVCQSHSVSACTSTCLCRAHTCTHRKPRCCYSNYTSRCSFFLIEKYVVEGEKLSTHKVLYTAPESIAARRRPFYQTFIRNNLHSPCNKFYKQGKSARIVATTTDTSYLCLGSACRNPEQFTTPPCMPKCIGLKNSPCKSRPSPTHPNKKALIVRVGITMSA